MYINDMRTGVDIPVVEISADELRTGDYVGTLHGVGRWEVRNANHYVGWCSVSAILVTSAEPERIGQESTVTVTAQYGGGLARCYRPLVNVDR